VAVEIHWPSRPLQVNLIAPVKKGLLARPSCTGVLTRTMGLFWWTRGAFRRKNGYFPAQKTTGIF